MVEEGSTVHHHDLTSVPLPEQLSPNAELLDDLADWNKLLLSLLHAGQGIGFHSLLHIGI